MLLGNLAMIAPEAVAEQHYFLEEWVNPSVLWGLRAVCVIAGIVALLLYFKLKRRRGE